MHPYLLRHGGLVISSYPFLYGLGVAMAGLVIALLLKRRGYSLRRSANLFMAAAIAVVLGGLILYGVVRWSSVKAGMSKFLSLSAGGQILYGSLILNLQVAGHEWSVGMTKKATYITCVSILVMLAVGVFVVPGVMQYHRHRQVEWWLDHSYPIATNLIHQDHLHFASYQDWSKAGKEIPSIGPILVRMYDNADSEYDRTQLLYAMGAVASPRTVAVLLGTVQSTDSPKLREEALIYGLATNIEDPCIQEGLLGIVKDIRQPLDDRCWVLAELIHAGSAGARDYARQHGQGLLASARASGVIERYTVVLAEQIDKIDEGSQSMPSEASE